METLVILSKLEQEYLLRAIEAAARVRDLRSFFLWTQGQLQALLPHAVLVAMQFGPDAQLQRLECLHASVMDEAARLRLCDPDDGLAVRLARHCAGGVALPCMAEAGSGLGPLAAFDHALLAGPYANLLLHGTGNLSGGATLFLLLDMPMKPNARTAYFLELLLPHLHLALLRLSAEAAAEHTPAARPLSEREIEILSWVREGKSNYEVGRILGISALTVKNHLQRIYKTLGVSNRTHALSRSLALHLLGPERRK